MFTPANIVIDPDVQAWIKWANDQTKYSWADWVLHSDVVRNPAKIGAVITPEGCVILAGQCHLPTWKHFP